MNLESGAGATPDKIRKMVEKSESVNNRCDCCDDEDIAHSMLFIPMNKHDKMSNYSQLDIPLT